MIVVGLAAAYFKALPPAGGRVGRQCARVAQDRGGWGDFSGVAASVPATIGMLRSSRNFEREADEFAIAFLEADGLSAQPLHDFFVKIRDHEAHYGADSIPEFLSTHPSTEERLERLRRDSP